jgi:hypothetical protein
VIETYINIENFTSNQNYNKIIIKVILGIYQFEHVSLVSHTNCKCHMWSNLSNWTYFYPKPFY